MGTLDGREAVIVPTVALLGNSVIRPMGSTGPEFVPSDVLAMAPSGWNGRPVLPIHPWEGRASANDPLTQDKYKFGQLFNTRFEDGKLKTDAWLDPVRAEKVGEDAVSVISNCQSGKMVEVSIGALVVVEELSGESPSGEDYEFIWRGILSTDHLAMGLAGGEGACNLEMGCGAPRNAINTEAKDMKSDKSGKKAANPLARLLQSVMSAIRSGQGNTEGVSDSELRNKLSEALQATEPAFINDYYYGGGIIDVWQDSSTVVYYTNPGDEWILWQQTYTLAADGTVTLNGDRQQVEYRPVPVSDTETTDSEVVIVTASECGCGKTAGQTALKETKMDKANMKDLLGRLTSGSATDEDRKALKDEYGFEAPVKVEVKAEVADAAKPEAAVKAEPIAAAAAVTTPLIAATAGGSGADPKPKTEEEWLADPSTPESLRNLVRAAKAEDTAKRAYMITALGKAQTVFNEAQLKAKSTEDLVAFFKLCKIGEGDGRSSTIVRDYSGIGFPGASDEPERKAPPKPYDDALKAMGKKPVHADNPSELRPN